MPQIIEDVRRRQNPCWFVYSGAYTILYFFVIVNHELAHYGNHHEATSVRSDRGFEHCWCGFVFEQGCPKSQGQSGWISCSQLEWSYCLDVLSILSPILGQGHCFSARIRLGMVLISPVSLISSRSSGIDGFGFTKCIIIIFGWLGWVDILLTRISLPEWCWDSRSKWNLCKLLFCFFSTDFVQTHVFSFLLCPSVSITYHLRILWLIKKRKKQLSTY